MGLFTKKQIPLLDGYKPKKFQEGYVEGPLAHYKNVTSTQIENEFFMQWIHPIKLHMMALRSPVGYRLTYGFSKDVFNNKLGIKIPEHTETAAQINKILVTYLESRSWFIEMQKLDAMCLEQGESILLNYHADIITEEDFDKEVHPNEEILKVEAINYMDYRVVEWEKNGDPKRYRVSIRAANRGMRHIPIHASRIIRYSKENIEQREKGYGLLPVVYDSIVILMNIVKGAGEAAFRWGTGHPVIMTQDVLDEEALTKLMTGIGTPTRRSWHVLPSEFVKSFEMVGQAGAMLNLKSLADIVIDQIVIASSYPKHILLGEAGGIISGSEITERGYFALIDREHTDLEPTVKEYFRRDVNVRKILNGIEYWDIDWGIREVLNKMDQIEYRQKEISNALALTTICTVNECRRLIGFEDLPDWRGDFILGIDQLIEEAPEENDYKEANKSTSKQKSSTSKDLEKNKSLKPNPNKVSEGKAKLRDAFSLIREDKSMDEISEDIGIVNKTLRKLLKWSEED